MLSGQSDTGRQRIRPLTHSACLAASQRDAAGGAGAGRPWVRVRVRRSHPVGPYVLCGQVVKLRDNGTEWFKLETCMGPVWVLGAYLRMCSGDGRCTCEPDPAPKKGPTHSWQSSDGSTGEETQQPCDLQRGCDIQPSRCSAR